MKRHLYSLAILHIALIGVLLDNENVPVNADLTDGERSWLKAHPVIRIAPDPDFPPIESFENGTYVGISADFIELLQADLGVTFKPVRCKTWDDVLKKAQDRQVDLLPAAANTAQRRNYLLFTPPHIVLPGVIITKKTNTASLTMAKLKPLRVGVVAGYSWHEFISRDYPDLNLYPVPDLKTGLTSLALGDIDAMIATLPVAIHYIEQEGITNLRVAGETGYYTNLSFGIRSDWPELHAILIKKLNNIPQTEKNKILNKWIRIQHQPPEPSGPIWLIVGSVSCVCIIVLVSVLVVNSALKAKVRDRTAKLEAVNAALEKAKLDAENANLAKSKFLTNMSHEIRTPMNAILGFSEILESVITDSKQKRYLNNICQSGKTLLTIIEDILDIAEIESGSMELVFKAVSIKKILQEINQLFKQKVQDKGLEMVFEISQEVPSTILTDESRLRQALINVIGNAIKFTDSGYIRVAASADISDPHKNLTIIIEDTGAGIDPMQVESIFDPFVQQEQHQMSSFGGTGLGLTITKRLITMMNGDITVCSKPGKGSTFTIVLRDIKIPTALTKSIQESIPTSSLQFIKFSPAKILIVDDIEYNRELLKSYLNGYQFTLLDAWNGQDALDQCYKSRPDLILLDLKMPVMSGYKAAAIMKHDPDLKQIPIIAVTAAISQEERNAISPICNAYLKKPVSQPELIREIMHFLPHITKA